MIIRMLGDLLKTVLRPRSTTAATATVEPVDPIRDKSTRHYEAAVRGLYKGKVQKAVAGCKEALAVEPNFSPAHFLLASIELPGEDYHAVMARIHAHLRPRTCVETRVSFGESIRLIGQSTRAIGIDPEPRVDFTLGPNVSIVAETSDDFFAHHDVRAELGGLPIDLAFIDGMHQFEFALRDFMNIEALCAPSSTILIHDVHPLDEQTATRERVTDFWSGDIWRLALLLRKHRPDLSFHTIAAGPTGLAIVRNLDPNSRYIRTHLQQLIDEYMAVEFDALNGRKAESLAVMPNDWSRISALLDEPPSKVSSQEPMAVDRVLN
jgi:hypothetical protein